MGVYIQPQMSTIINFGFLDGFWSAFGYHHQHWLRQHAVLFHVQHQSNGLPRMTVKGMRLT